MYLARGIYTEFLQFLRTRGGAELRLLDGDTCRTDSSTQTLGSTDPWRYRSRARCTHRRGALRNHRTLRHRACFRALTRILEVRPLYSLSLPLNSGIRHGVHPCFFIWHCYSALSPLGEAQINIPLWFGEGYKYAMFLNEPFKVKYATSVKHGLMRHYCFQNDLLET